MKKKYILTLASAVCVVMFLAGCGQEYKDIPSEAYFPVPGATDADSPVTPVTPVTPTGVVDTDTKILYKGTLGEHITDACLSTDGTKLYFIVRGASDGKIIERDMATGAEVELLSGLSDPFSLKYHDGKLFYTTDATTQQGKLNWYGVEKDPGTSLSLANNIDNPRYISMGVNTVLVPVFGRGYTTGGGLWIYDIKNNNFYSMLTQGSSADEADRADDLATQRCFDSFAYIQDGITYNNIYLSGSFGSIYQTNVVDFAMNALDAGKISYDAASQGVVVPFDNPTYNSDAQAVYDLPNHETSDDLNLNISKLLAMNWDDVPKVFTTSSIVCQVPDAQQQRFVADCKCLLTSATPGRLYDYQSAPMMSPICDSANSQVIVSMPWTVSGPGASNVPTLYISQVAKNDLTAKTDYTYPVKAVYKQATDNQGTPELVSPDPKRDSTIPENASQAVARHTNVGVYGRIYADTSIPYAFRLAQSKVDPNRFYFTAHGVSSENSNAGIWILKGNQVEKAVTWTAEEPQDYPSVVFVNDKRTYLPAGYEEIIWVCSGDSLNFDTGDFDNSAGLESKEPYVYSKIIKVN